MIARASSLTAIGVPDMTIKFRQDPFDGRCLEILSQGVPQPPPLEPSDSPTAPVDGWKRILYEENDRVPDNFTPDTFLSSLSVNMDVRIYEYLPCVAGTVKAMSLHACLVPIFFVLFYFLRSEALNPLHVIAVDVVLLVLGYAAREVVVRQLLRTDVQTFIGFASPRVRSHGSDTGGIGMSHNSPSLLRVVETSGTPDWSLLSDLKRAVLVFGTLYTVAPILRTLTRTWSEATIIAIAVTMLIVHLVFHDYVFISKTKSSLEQWYLGRGDMARVKREWKRVDTSLALNAIIFSAIVLASRLDSFEAVFGFTFFSISAFAFLPFVLKAINLLAPAVFLWLVCPAGVVATATMLHVFVGKLPMSIFAGVVTIVAFICPYVLIKALPLKKAIKGPWDIAHVSRRVLSTSSPHGLSTAATSLRP